MFTKKGPAMFALSVETPDEFRSLLQTLERSAERLVAGTASYPLMILMKDPSVAEPTWRSFSVEAAKEFEVERSRTKHEGRQN